MWLLNANASTFQRATDEFSLLVCNTINNEKRTISPFILHVLLVSILHRLMGALPRAKRHGRTQ